MGYTTAQLQAVHELPLDQDVEWIDLSYINAGTIVEKTKRKPKGLRFVRWVGVELCDSEMAARVVEIHNDWLKRKANK